jgi:hypothetical protein
MGKGSDYCKYQAGLMFLGLLASWDVLHVTDVCTVYEIEDLLAVESGMRAYE